jgi:hypothetical protein
VIELEAQSGIHGYVIDENNMPIEYFDAIVRNVNDSSMVQGGAFVDGIFEFQGLRNGQYILQLSCVGFITKYLNCSTTETDKLDIGTIMLKHLLLDEIEVGAKRPVITRKEGNLVVQVKNSSLSNAGTSLDVLQRSPGVIVDSENNISVIGKGSPVIFINNKEVNSKNELELLQSVDIESIEINRNPSAEYSASGHAVVKITTKKITKEQLNIMVYNNSYFGRKYSNVLGFQINNNIKKMSNYLSYSYSNSNQIQHIEAYENNFLTDDTVLNRNKEENSQGVKKHNIFYGFKYSFNQNNELGFQFTTSLSQTNTTAFRDETIYNTNSIIFREINSAADRSSGFYDVNLNYRASFDSITSFLIIVDFASNRLKSTDNLSEKDKGSNNQTFTEIDNASFYNVITSRVDLDKVLFEHWKTKIGAKYSLIVNNSNNDIESQNSIANVATNSNIHEQVPAAYVSLKRQFNKLGFEAGIRYEYTLSVTTIYESVNDIIKQEYSNFFPSLLIDYEHSDNFNVSLSYSYRINRPGFYEINPKIDYFDSLSYGMGNPLIKPTLSHNFELGVYLFKNFAVTFDYTKELDKRIQAATNDENNPNITKYIHTNIDKARSFSLGLSYQYSNRFFTNYSYLALEKPYILLPYFNTTRVVQQPIWYFQTSNEFNILKNITFFINFEYESNGESDISYWKESYNISSGIYARLFEKKLFLSLSVNDILKTCTNSWHDKYINIESGQSTDMDSRWFKFSIRYNFNQFRDVFEKKSSNQEDLNRL